MKYVKPFTLFEHLMKQPKRKPRRLLGLDVGDKYVGLAVSDSKNQTASPLSVLVRKKSNIDMMATDFQNLISEFSLAGFVVGCPFRLLNKTHSPDVALKKVFVDELWKTGKIEHIDYTFWDESFSSKNVESLLPPDMHPVEAKTMLDKFAAVVILQEYLDSMNRKWKAAKDGDAES